MPDGTCMVCGRVIPEGRHICLSCEGQNEMQQFACTSGSGGTPKQYFRIVDDCGWSYIVATNNPNMTVANIALLVPHVRSAAEITKEEAQKWNHENT